MKFSTQEEYGLRCLATIARGESATIPEISRREGLTEPHVAKLMTELRKGNLITSTRGQQGGYSLARPANEITVSEILDVLGGKLYDESFCERHSGKDAVCSRAMGCSIKSLWGEVQQAIDSVLTNVTLADIAAGEEAEEKLLQLSTELPEHIRGRKEASNV